MDQHTQHREEQDELSIQIDGEPVTREAHQDVGANNAAQQDAADSAPTSRESQETRSSSISQNQIGTLHEIIAQTIQVELPPEVDAIDGVLEEAIQSIEDEFEKEVLLQTVLLDSEDETTGTISARAKADRLTAREIQQEHYRHQEAIAEKREVLRENERMVQEEQRERARKKILGVYEPPQNVYDFTGILERNPMPQ